MSPGAWVVVAVLAALALYGAGAVGWRLGRRAAIEGGGADATPRPREVAPRVRADRLVDLGALPALLDRRDVLIVATVTTGTGVREEVVETAVLDTTGVVRLDASRTRPWPAVYGALVELLAAATLVVGYGAARHLRMLAQTAERHGLKKLPTTDWGCLMRRYTEAVAGAGARWIELPAARSRERIAAPGAPGALEDARAALRLLRILARREGER